MKLDRYRRELDAVDMPQLLSELLDKLDLIRAIIPAYEEAQLILTVASSRLAALLTSYFDREPADTAKPDPSAILNYEELETFANTQARAAVWEQARGKANSLKCN